MIQQEMRLFSPEGERLYLTKDERERFCEASLYVKRNIKALCLTMHYTGCRISEALEMTPKSVDFSNCSIIIRSLKKRDPHHYREIPVPEQLITDLDNIFGIIEQRNKRTKKEERLWSWKRQHANVLIKNVMIEADIKPGKHRCPKGLRHGFGVAAVVSGVPLSTLKKWLGHESIETTAIYANAIGQEERAIAQRMW